MSNRTTYLLTPNVLLEAYAAGIFPMAESASSRELRWFDPPVRAIIPLDDNFHVPKRLARTIRHCPYEITLNQAFPRVISACAEPDHAKGRANTWINPIITDLYTSLHKRGHAHSVEVWDQGELVGGLYGVSLGAAFFGESMFSSKRDASKIALVYLVALLRACGFTLLDTQFQTEHLAQFGTHEITRMNYHHLLAAAVSKKNKLKPLAKEEWNQLAAGAAGSGG